MARSTLDLDTTDSDLTAGYVEYAVKEHLKANGYVVLASGDADSNYSSSGDIITSFGSGANGMNNDGAWYRIQSPNGLYEWIRQIGDVSTTSPGQRTKFSRRDGFTGGSPSITQVPSATDEELELGGGTDASPTYSGGSYASATSGSDRRLLGVVDDAAPYGFWYWGTDNFPNNRSRFVWAHDPVLSPFNELGIAIADADPYVNVYLATGTDMFARSAFGTENFGGVIKRAFVDGSYVDVGNNMTTDFITNGLEDNPDNGQKDFIPLVWVNDANGQKGISTLFYGLLQASALREYYTIEGNDNILIIASKVGLLWDGSAVADDGDANSWAAVDANFLSWANFLADSTAPEFFQVSPSIGILIEQNTSVILRATDDSSSIDQALISVNLDITQPDELVFDGTNFSKLYNKSSVISISNGYEWTIIRNGGWPSQPRFTGYLADPSGNVFVGPPVDV